MKIFIVFAAIVLLIAVTEAAADCDGITVGDTCYYWLQSETGGKKKNEAEKLCGQQGGSLADIPSEQAYSEIFLYLLRIPFEGIMVLTGMEFDTSVSKKKPLLGSGMTVPYKPQWFEGHPIHKDKYEEIVVVPSKNDKFAGILNAANDCRYTFFLCQKSA